MPPRRTPANDSADVPERRGPVTGERELIVVAAPARGRTVGAGAGAPAESGALAAIVTDAGARIRPLFGASPERLRNEMTARATAGAPAADLPDLSVYYRVDAPDEKLDDLADQLRGHASVAAAYVKPAAEPAVTVKTPVSTPQYRPPASTMDRMTDSGVVPLNDMLPRVDEAPPATPDFTSRQIYLQAAPAGIDAVFAWTQPGGSGAGVRIIDIEGEWRFTHEDLTANQGGVVGGTQPNDLGWRNHGTAVIGEFGGDRNGVGITGICPDANVRAISIFGIGTAPAIRRAADLLSPGDIILIELHRPGPRATGVGQQGFIAIEWWPDDFDAIRYAIARGVIVVEAAGNGAENLDAAIYDTPGAGFPASWSNPFRRGTRDSGAILVGAGAPPPGTHGRDHGPDRSRLDFSNFGSAVDAQGWGREVTTAGYGDLQGGSNENYWYTDQFSGTSSASPIVVGALGCVQGNRRARGIATLTPATARNLLRTTGTPQQDAPGRPSTQRIGNRPNLRQVVTGAVPIVLSVPVFRYWNPTSTDHFYTTNWAELGPGKYGYVFEGIQCYSYPSQVPGTLPLYRYWNPARGDHFYTTNWGELGPGRYGYGYEGVQCYVFAVPATNRVPLYRYWNAAVGDHFYTTNWAELGWGRYGWVFEGIQCYVATQVRPPTDTDTPDAGEIGFESANMETHVGANGGTNGGAHGSGIAGPDDVGAGVSPLGRLEAPSLSTTTPGQAASIPATFATPEIGLGSAVPTSFATADAAGQVAGQASSFTTSSGNPPSSFEVKHADRTGVTLTIRVEGGGSSQT